jgi:hypothetical protein
LPTMGSIILHGPHHEAQNWTRTGSSLSTTSDCQVDLLTSGTEKQAGEYIRFGVQAGPDKTESTECCLGPINSKSKLSPNNYSKSRQEKFPAVSLTKWMSKSSCGWGFFLLLSIYLSACF